MSSGDRIARAHEMQALVDVVKADLGETSQLAAEVLKTLVSELSPIETDETEFDEESEIVEKNFLIPVEDVDTSMDVFVGDIGDWHEVISTKLFSTYVELFVRSYHEKDSRVDVYKRFTRCYPIGDTVRVLAFYSAIDRSHSSSSGRSCCLGCLLRREE